MSQFLTGLFPAVFGGEMDSQQTASGYAMARDQALGRLGLVWRRLKTFYSDLMLLSVDCFRRNRPADAEMPFLGPGGEFESRWIRLADLKGNIQAYPEGDETFPRLKSQQRAVIQQLMASSDPMIQQALADPANMGFVKSALGLPDMVVPGEDSRNKQLREIDTLLTGAPIVGNNSGAQNAESSSEHRLNPVPPETALAAHDGDGAPNDAAAHASHSPSAAAMQPRLISSVPIDLLFDDHSIELQECRRWANSDAGQLARMENPAGFANVHAHAEDHLRAIGLAYAGQSAAPRSTSTPA